MRPELARVGVSGCVSDKTKMVTTFLRISKFSCSQAFKFGRRCYSTNTPFPPVPPEGNTPDTIKQKIGKNLHLTPNHPLNYIKAKIQSHFNRTFLDYQGTPIFSFFDRFEPKVSVKNNFDDLLFPNDHVGRSPTDTYYLNPSTVLRTHTSAHQSGLFTAHERAFLVTGDVYRRDEIDSSHYPVFHQMEGARLFPLSSLPPAPAGSSLSFDQPTTFYYNDDGYKNHPQVQYVAADLKKTLEGLVQAVFGKVEMRWIDTYFPFTSPSYELEIFFNNAWLEVLGCGVVHPEILKRCGVHDQIGWAFGLGLERLAMVLFDIPDIRLFWSSDKRFHQQFQLPPTAFSKDGDVNISNIKFKPFSKFPECYKDVAFWLPLSGYHENHFYEIVRDIAGDLCESVKLVDKFTHPKTNKTSHCYRINYRSMERNLTNEETNKLQADVIKQVVDKLHVTIR